MYFWGKKAVQSKSKSFVDWCGKAGWVLYFRFTVSCSKLQSLHFVAMQIQHSECSWCTVHYSMLCIAFSAIQIFCWLMWQSRLATGPTISEYPPSNIDSPSTQKSSSQIKYLHRKSSSPSDQITISKYPPSAQRSNFKFLSSLTLLSQLSSKQR